jgi:hypothetical protein
MRTGSLALRLVALVARLYGWLLVAGLLLIGLAWVIRGPFDGSALGFCDEVGGTSAPLLPGVTRSEDALCVRTASALQSTLHFGHQAVPAAYGLVVTVLVVRVLGAAVSGGAFADAVPARLRALGWALVAGQPISALLTGLSAGVLRSTMVSGATVGSSTWAVAVSCLSWAAIGAGLAVLAFRAVIVEGVSMRRDLEGTV